MKIKTKNTIIIVIGIIITITILIVLLIPYSRPVALSLVTQPSKTLDSQLLLGAEPPILAINLPERKDRRLNLQQEFRSWHQQPEIIEAVRRKPGWKGCTLSHLKCIEIAKQRKYPWVLCIEDDCQLTPDALKYFQNILPYLWANRDKWDIYSGGISQVKRTGEIICKKNNIIAANGYATHFILIHEGTYDKVLNDISKDDDKIQKIDVYYNDNLRTWTSVPFIAVQRIDKSDIEGRYTDYSEIFKNAENKLLNIIKLAIH